MGRITGSAAAEIEAPIERVYAAAADGVGATEWTELKVAEMLEADSEGRPLRVRTETETPIKTIVSVLRYSYEEPTRVSWVQEEGDLKSVEGSWEIEDLGGRTAVTYALEVDPGRILGMAMRGPVLDVLRGRMIESMPERLKAFVEGA
jgi:Polyketide cyclase / dehydrase and lipid transport